MANVYCQIRGTKRLLLFPPSDVTQLGFAPGASSSSMDVIGLLATGKLPGTVHAHEAVVGPGDVLFLPALWPHAASVESRPTATTTTSIAVNVFFRNLDEAVYSRTGRDVYGNRDVAAYERGRQLVANVARGFAGLPRDVREFYMRRLAEELLEKAGE